MEALTCLESIVCLFSFFIFLVFTSQSFSIMVSLPLGINNKLYQIIIIIHQKHKIIPFWVVANSLGILVFLAFVCYTIIQAVIRIVSRMSQIDPQNYFNMIIEMVCSSAGYERVVSSEMLADYKTYFNICHGIFGQLRIKIVKIEQNNHNSPGEKLQHLIEFLIEELQLYKTDLDLDISGYEIVKGNMEHIFKLMQILFLESNIYIKNKIKLRSEEDLNNRLRQNQAQPFKSARGPKKSEDNNQEKSVNVHYLQSNQVYASQRPPKQPQPPNRNQNSNHLNHHHQPSNNNYQSFSKPLQSKHHQPSKNNRDIHPNNNSSKDYSYYNKTTVKKKAKKSDPKFSKQSKRARSHQEERKNVFVQMANIVMKQKGKMLQAATRDQRKGRLSEIKNAKNAYKIYLKRFAKENRAEQNRQVRLKERKKAKQPNHQLDINDFEHIDNCFESFAYKLRDKKAAFIQNIQKIVHKKELERYYFQNKIQRQLKKSINESLEQDLMRQNNEHKVRKQLIKQQSKILENKTSSLQKEIRLHHSKGKREVKDTKMKELKKIESILNQDNERMMMIFEDGGRLQQLIGQMYKRF